MNKHFKVLYINHYKQVYTSCYYILKNHQLAEEITQETFLTAYQKLDELKDLSKFSAWINVIATNKSITLYNRNKKEVLVDDEEIIDYINVEMNFNLDFSNKLINVEVKEKLKEALNSLKSEHKQLIILKYHRDLTDQEIADIMSKPLGTIKSTLHRIKKNLLKKVIELGLGKDDLFIS